MIWLNRVAAIASILAAAVVLAETPQKKKEPAKKTADQEQIEQKDQRKLNQIPLCPKGCVPGRKSGLVEHFSKCPDGCRPGDVE
jgi:hypothetical protein